MRKNLYHDTMNSESSEQVDTQLLNLIRLTCKPVDGDLNWLRLNLTNTNDRLGDKQNELRILSQRHKKWCSKIKTVIYNNNNATHLNWLQFFPNVVVLFCSHNNISSFSWLQNNLQIKIIYAAFNPRLSNLSALSCLTNLKTVLTDKLVCVYIAKNMPSLRNVRFVYTNQELGDLLPITRCSDNLLLRVPCADVEQLGLNVENVLQYIYKHLKTGVYDKGCLRNQILCLENSNDFLTVAEDILEQIDERDPDLLSIITHLIYNNNRAKNLEWLKYFPNLTYIDFRNNEIESLSWVKYTPKLRDFCGDNNEIESISGIGHAKELIYLSLSNNPLETLSESSILELSSLNNLLSLHISRCELTELTLRSMQSLRYLYCEYNMLRKITLIGISLEIFHCYNNQLVEIIGFRELTSLISCWCSYNDLSSLDGISQFLRLSHLRCNGNKKLINIKHECSCLNLEKFIYDRMICDPDSYRWIDTTDMCNICFDCMESASDANDATEANEATEATEATVSNIQNHKIMTVCRHVFHYNCLDKWFEQYIVCPLCRQMLP